MNPIIYALIFVEHFCKSFAVVFGGFWLLCLLRDVVLVAMIALR